MWRSIEGFSESNREVSPAVIVSGSLHHDLGNTISMGFSCSSSVDFTPVFYMVSCKKISVALYEL